VDAMLVGIKKLLFVTNNVRMARKQLVHWVLGVKTPALMNTKNYLIVVPPIRDAKIRVLETY
jgi:hypothetical protein